MVWLVSAEYNIRYVEFESCGTMIRRLEDLVAPLSEREFLDSFSQKRRVVVKTNQPERAASLLPWVTINHLIASVMPSSDIIVKFKRETCGQLMYRRGPEGRLRPDSLQQLAAQGVSIVLNSVHKHAPPIATLANAIERRIGHRVWVNCYITFGTVSAFKPHYDTHDVLAVQVHGAKRWRGYNIPIAYPLEDFPPKVERQKIAYGDHVWEELIEPGDMLYVPRGEAHDAVAEVKPSVHLTIGIQVPTGLDLLNWMAQRAKNDVVLRMDLTRVGGEEPLRDHGLVLKRHLHELIDQLSFDAFLDNVDQQRSMRVRLNLGFNNVLRPDTWLSPTPKRRIALAPSNGETEVTLGGSVFRLSADARRTLHLLLEADGLSYAALAEKLATTVENNELRGAVAQLVAKGLVAVETPDESSYCGTRDIPV
jgi:ribosomal protein L16 Arg81 hydroxylase